MIQAKCHKCGYEWFARRIDENGDFVKPNNCPKCRTKDISSSKYFLSQIKTKQMKSALHARSYKEAWQVYGKGVKE